MSESLSIDNSAFDGVISEARQLSRQFERQIRAYENVRNILNGVEENSRNNISQASSDLERKIQDLQSKKESVDRFIRTVTEFRADVNNTENNVVAEFSSDNKHFPRLSGIGPVQNVVRAKNKSVVTLFTAFLDMGHDPTTLMRTMPLFSANTSRAPTPALPTPRPESPTSPPGSASTPQPRPPSSPPGDNHGSVRTGSGTSQSPSRFRNWGSFMRGFFEQGAGFLIESRSPPQPTDTLSTVFPVLLAFRAARDMFEFISVIIDRVESIEQLTEILGEVPEVLWGNIIYIRENLHQFRDMDSLSPEEAKEFGRRAASAYRELIATGFIAKGGIKYLTSKIKKALPGAKPPGDAVPPKGAGSVPKNRIVHDTYNKMRNKIGKEGADKFIEAMNNGLVGDTAMEGIKKLTGTVKVGGVKYTHEVKVFGRFANYRLYGKKVDGAIVFSHFSRALH